ncbi:hypothetical protein A4D02_11835 [Niastella koreensis]|uniref:Uncharacterized protein n=2 Tax=Niastella koreensis TaxID=354356 RepID=G8TH27_NIAKG|nr:hypothetical protein [Niastella koreensis]AEW00638.1 hypothetical protein Niako_4379 [Niastella koreensis GR20-10]OQP42271.1 hypothetical protein A4D02_11835 [Niastella koreensis]
MKLLKTLVIATTLIISCNHLFAQKKEDTAGVEKNWYIKGAFPVSETQSLAIWAHKKAEYGIVMVNNKGGIEWEMPFKGCILGISKYKDHFLVFYAKKGYYDDHYGITKYTKQINAATIDIKSQQIIEDKTLYAGKYVNADLLNDASGNFIQFVLHYFDGYNSKGFYLLTFNADGSVANKDVPGIATEQKYIASSAGKDGSFFVGYLQNWSSLVVEKFSHEGALLSKLESPLTMRKDLDYKTVMRTDPGNNNSIAISLRLVNKDLDYVCSHFLFNFDNNQVDTVNEAPLAKKTTPYHFERYRELIPVDILFTNDKVIVVREPRYGETSINNKDVVTYNSGTALVSVFDKQMKLQRDIAIRKLTSTYAYINIGLNCRIINDNLIFLSGENANGGFDNFSYKVNLNDGSFGKKKIGTNKPAYGTSISTLSTIWFKNELIITHLSIPISFGINNYRSKLERVGFDEL